MAGVVDWRDTEDCVVWAIASQLPDPDVLTCNEPETDEAPFLIVYRGRSHEIPLTSSGVDRYVTISSLIEILRGDFRLYLRAGCERDDTHLIIVVEESVANALERDHAAWRSEHLIPVEPGLDYFSGLRIPYYGHTDNNPDFEGQYAAREQVRRSVEEEVKSLLRSGRRSKPWWQFW